MVQKSDKVFPVIQKLVDQEFPDRSDKVVGYNAGYVTGSTEPQSEEVQTFMAEIAFWWGMNRLAERALGKPDRDLPNFNNRLS